jgi:hypothetical protein
MVVVRRLEWNRLKDMYKLDYLVITVCKSFCCWGQKWETRLIERKISF